MALGGSARKNPRGQDFRYLSIGSGDVLYNARKVTVSVNPAEIAATSRGSTAVVVAGVKVGDVVFASPPATLEDDLLFVGAAVTDDDEVTIYLYNPTGAPVDGDANDWVLFHVGLS